MTPVNRPVTAFGALGQLHGFGKSLGAVLILFPILSALPAFIVFNNWAESKHLEKTWTIAGAACPVVATPSPAATRHHKPPTTFWYGDVRFTRSFGGAECGAVPENPFWPSTNYRVCRFNNPGAVTVYSRGRTTVFQPPVGNPATVTVRRGQASCVIGGWFQI